MWKAKLCLGINDHAIALQRMEEWKKIGFEGFFIDWSRGTDLMPLREKADELGLDFQSIHAPFGKADRLWKSGAEADDAVSELIECLHICAAVRVPIMVMHAFIGFRDHTPTPEGPRNFAKILAEAEKCGVTVALENTEGEEYLAARMNAFPSHPNLGFCWDTGHEMCYNRSRDMLALYGDRLVCTHINDNLGISNFDGNITWTDDLHLLPFDGIADWDNIADRLNAHGYNGTLTFELNRKSKPDRHDNDRYASMDDADYFARAYAAACRFAALKERRK